MANPKARLLDVSPRILRTWIAADQAILVDVREPGENAGERIAGGLLRPLSRFDTTALPTEDGRIPVLYCGSGKRSTEAAGRLLRSGWEEVHHLKGGILAWKAAGGVTETSAEAPISLERQVRIAAGALVLLAAVLGFVASPWFFGISGFVGAGLLFAGVTDTCAMGMILARLPYNQRVAAAPSETGT